jgi:hypothetical protein
MSAVLSYSSAEVSAISRLNSLPLLGAKSKAVIAPTAPPINAPHRNDFRFELLSLIIFPNFILNYF